MGRFSDEQIERFWQKVEKTDHCWIWKGAKTSGSTYLYGHLGVKVDGKKRWFRAHRVSYELTFGEVPDPIYYDLDHECENTLCVRPDHLKVLTKSDHNLTQHYDRSFI